VALAAAALALGLFLPAPLPAQAPPPSIPEICQAIRDQRAKLKSLDLEVDETEEFTVDPATVMKWLGRVGLHNGKQRFAFKGDKRFLNEHIPGPPDELDERGRPEVTADMPPEVQEQQRQAQAIFDKAREDLKASAAARRGGALSRGPKGPPPSTTRAFNGGKTVRIQMGAASGSIYPTTGAYGQRHAFSFHFLWLAGVYIEDPTDDLKMREEKGASTIDALLKRSSYSIAEDVLDGVRCWRLEGQVKSSVAGAFKDRLWLAPHAGYALLRRENYDPHSGALIWRSTCADLREVTPGCWLPMQVTVEDCAPYAPPELRGKALSVRRFHVTRCEVNNVPDELFDHRFPDRALIIDFTKPQGKNGSLYSYHQSDNDRLDQSIDTLVGKMSPFSVWLLVSAGVGALLLAALAFVLWRRRPGQGPAA
jgi:hypothetical protein